MSNGSENDNLNIKDNDVHPETIVIINCALNIPLMLISITGNSLELAAILRTPSLRSPSTVFLCSLADSDLIVGLVVQPVYIANEFTSSVSPLNHAENSLSVLACGVSLVTMTAISVDRFLALHCHMRYPNLMTEKRALYTSGTIWLTCIMSSCLSLWSRKSYFLIIAVGVAICLLISSCSYVRIYQIVRQHQLQIHAQQQAVGNLNSTHNLNMVQSKKSAINTFLFYLCMILCYSPVFISTLIEIVSRTHTSKAWTLADAVAFMNSSINPILYCWRLRELRTAVLKTVRKTFCKQTEED